MMPLMPVAPLRVEDTPNPQAMKFIADRPFPLGPTLDPGKMRSYRAAADAQAAGDTLAEALFATGPVMSVMIVGDFVTVNKTPSARWPRLRPKIESVLRQHVAE